MGASLIDWTEILVWTVIWEERSGGDIALLALGETSRFRGDLSANGLSGLAISCLLSLAGARTVEDEEDEAVDSWSEASPWRSFVDPLSSVLRLVTGGLLLVGLACLWRGPSFDGKTTPGE